MSCVLEVYDVVWQRSPAGRYVHIHTNLGYSHYENTDGWVGLLKCVGWQVYPVAAAKMMGSTVKRRARYDSWLWDGPPECQGEADAI